ncbi:MAG: hypothetical protein K6G73_02680 [Marinilabiliaceae bacterium]|nr:hypothetical protein [Marinilabiliaceae bacterium]
MKNFLTLFGLAVVLCTTKAYAEVDKTRIFSTSENTQVEFAPYNLMAEWEFMTPEGEEDEIRVATEFLLSENYEEFTDAATSFPWGCNKMRNSVNGISDEDTEYFDAATTLNEINSDFGGDWGEQVDYDYINSWRTPTYEELDYILNKRPNAAQRRYNLYLWNDGFQGLMLLPDNPSENLQALINQSNVLNGNDLHIGADSSAYFQEEGAIILSYENNGGDNIAEYYWTATGYNVEEGIGNAPHETAMALYIKMDEENGPQIDFVNIERVQSAKVRLVRSAYKVTLVPNVPERGDTAVGYSRGIEDVVYIDAAPKDGFEYYHSYDCSNWDYANENYLHKVGIRLDGAESDTTITAFYRSTNQITLRVETEEIFQDSNVQIQATDELGIATWDYIYDSGYTSVKSGEWTNYDYFNENVEYPDMSHYYVKYGVGDVVNLHTPATIDMEVEVESGQGADGGQIFERKTVTYVFDKWVATLAGEDYITAEQAADTILTFTVTIPEATPEVLDLVVTPLYVLKQEIKSIDELVAITSGLNGYASDEENNSLVELSDVITTNNNVVEMTTNDLYDKEDSELAELPKLSTITGKFTGQFIASEATIKDVLVQMSGSLFENIDAEATVQDLIFDNSAIYITEQSNNWKISEDGDTLFISLLAEEVGGIVDGFALTGRVIICDALQNQFSGENKHIILNIIGELKEGASVNGFFFDYEKLTDNKAVRVREVQPIRMDNGSSGGSCKMASTYSDFGVKKVVLDYNYTEEELTKSTRTFTAEEFASGAVAYWLNYSGPGYTGDYTAKWTQGAKYPVLAKSADNALYGINYTFNGTGYEDYITALPKFANAGSTVTIEYTQKPTSIRFDGKELELGETSVSFTMPAANKSVVITYPTATTYIVKFQTANGVTIKEEIADVTEGETYTASESQLANFEKDGATYKYVSGNEEKVAVKEASQNVISLIFESVVTAVSNIKADQTNDGCIYDLRGVKVTNPSRGIYIQNGQLIIVK